MIILIILCVIGILVAWRAWWVGKQIDQFGGVRAGVFGGTWVIGGGPKGLHVARFLRTVTIPPARISAVDHQPLQVIVSTTGADKYTIPAWHSGRVAEYVESFGSEPQAVRQV